MHRNAFGGRAPPEPAGNLEHCQLEVVVVVVEEEEEFVH